LLDPDALYPIPENDTPSTENFTKEFKGIPYFSITDSGGNRWYKTNFGAYEAVPYTLNSITIPQEKPYNAKVRLPGSAKAGSG